MQVACLIVAPQRAYDEPARQALTAYRLNMKNSDAPAVKREEQEDYGQEPDHELWAEK